MADFEQFLLQQAAEGDIKALSTLASEARRRGDNKTFELCQEYALKIHESLTNQIVHLNEQTEFLRHLIDEDFVLGSETVIVDKYNDKIQLIKLIRFASQRHADGESICMGLKEAKDLVDGSLPIIVKFRNKGARHMFFSELRRLPPTVNISAR
jgi:ribosomal protein L7/L12